LNSALIFKLGYMVYGILPNAFLAERRSIIQRYGETETG
ncbi:MAG: hypothetical protein CFH00_00725, partial [Alphaproteobacteria bacterium MarineAlpha1_Bin1]